MPASKLHSSPELDGCHGTQAATPYPFKCLVNVYKVPVPLNVYKIKR